MRIQSHGRFQPDLPMMFYLDVATQQEKPSQQKDKMFFFQNKCHSDDGNSPDDVHDHRFIRLQRFLGLLMRSA